jgi:uncharacterized membrane protein
VVVSALTGGASAKIVLISVAYFVGATGWSWWRFRERIQAAARADPSTDEQR